MTWRAVCRVSARPDLEAREAVVDGVGGALVGAVGARARGPARYCSPRHGMLRRRCPRLELSWIRCTTRSRTADKTRVQNACRGSRTWRAQFGCPYLTRDRRRRAKHNSQAPGGRAGGSVGLGNGDAGTGGGGCQACGATLQGLTLVPTSSQLELTLPLPAQPKLTVSPTHASCVRNVLKLSSNVSDVSRGSSS